MSATPSTTPSPVLETPPPVEPVFPEDTEVPKTPVVRAPRLEPLNSGFSLFSPQGAAVLAGATLLLLALMSLALMAVRHSKRRARQSVLEAKIYQAVQEMRQKSQLITGWGSGRPA